MMKHRLDPRRLMILVAAAVLASAAAPRAGAATNLLSAYIGGSYGHAEIRARDTSLITIRGIPAAGLGSFDIGHSAFQITAGVRGLELLGAEVDYFDLGGGGASPSWSGAGSVTSAHVSQKGEAAFAVLYLPIPIVNVYFKAGVARLTTELSASVSGSTCVANQACPLFCIVGGPCGGSFTANGSLDTTDTGFAGGAGVQLKLGDWAIRGEYERFSALGEHPSLASVGVTWSFL